MVKNNLKLEKLEMCPYDTDAPAQGHPQLHAGILQKNEFKKRDKSIFFKKKYQEENIF